MLKLKLQTRLVERYDKVYHLSRKSEVFSNLEIDKQGSASSLALSIVKVNNQFVGH